MTDRNDATRLTIRAEDRRRPRSVVARQGQVLLDADLDQQSRHLLDRVETATQDQYGTTGRLVVPGGSAAFAIGPAVNSAETRIGSGHGYLGGRQVQNAGECTLAGQPHPRPETISTDQVLYVLKTLIRYVDPVEEPAYADKALGDAQAAGRAMVDWQVFPYVPEDGWGDDFDCATVPSHEAWRKLVEPSSGTLTVLPATAEETADPCSLTPQGGYSRLENLLYRIEVHDGVPIDGYPDVDGPRFGLNGLRVKMSRRNASVLARITDVRDTTLTVEPPALDRHNWFAPGAYAEFVSVHDDIDPGKGTTWSGLFQVAHATDTTVRLAAAAKDLPATALSGDWFLRLWDAFPTGEGFARAEPDKTVELGDGLQIELGGSVFRRGDHWTFAARADGSIDWPKDQEETPHGPEIRYAPLAAVKPGRDDDCRIPAGALTDRVLHYRGGDGQAIPVPRGKTFAPLPSPLRVAVMRGRQPVEGATVIWRVPPDGFPCMVGGLFLDHGGITSTVTGPNGLSEVNWDLSTAHPDATHHLEAYLDDADATLTFGASFRTAAATSYEPGCDLLKDASNVQEALDTLCANVGGGQQFETLRITSIRMRGSSGYERELVRDHVILNGMTVSSDAFVNGILIDMAMPDADFALNMELDPFDPIVEVGLDLPYPATDPDRLYWTRASQDGDHLGDRITAPFGFQRIRLDGTVSITPTALEWYPSKMTALFLRSAPRHRWGTRINDEKELEELGWQQEHRRDILGLLRIRSAHVWADHVRGRRGRVYLNAEHLGSNEGVTRRELLVAARDPQRAADLDVFFRVDFG